MNEVFYYEDALSSEELANKILEVLENMPDKETLERISKKFEKAYSEEEIANEYLEVINKCLKRKE